ncbi:MAG: ABC transporter ATP-binding protein/permease [Gemmatimonadota bacterium]|nr:ABC transporter ATP-binding protein/permease [Gemmatimonadota bacterium]
MNWARFVWRYLSYRKGLLAALFVCAAVMAAAELSIPWLIKEAIDAVVDETRPIDLNAWAAVTLGILAVLYLAHVVLLRVAAHVIMHCSFHFRSRFFAHIHAQALPFFQRHRTGELMHRTTSDTKIFETEIAALLSEVPGEVVVVVGVTIMMIMLHAGMAVAVIAFMIVAAVVTSYLGRPLPSLRKSAQRVGAQLAARFQETIAGIRTVQGFTNERYELSRLDDENRKILNLELRERKVHAFMEPLADMIELLGIVLLVWYGGYLIIADEITAGALVAFIAYMEILARPLGHAEAYYRSVQSSRAVADRLRELLDDREVLPVHGDRSASGGPPSIVVEDVFFRYRGSDREILRNISFAITPGEVVAIVGRNGAGKSTLMDLLLRCYDPSSGRILASGIDLREWNLEAWRRSVGVATQDVFLFHGTIRENIAYGRPEATSDEIEQAVRESGLDRMTRRFPNGLDTLVGERGTALSGGERQAIGLARLFLRKPSLVLLDEPTAHLDGEALQLIRTALRQLMAGSTALIVTHNTETLQLATRVLFLENGALVGDGTHEALFSANAQYRALWEDQSRTRREAGRPSGRLARSGRDAVV